MELAPAEVFLFVADPAVHFGDTPRVLPSYGAVVAGLPNRDLAEAVIEMYGLDRAGSALPLALVERSSLSVTQIALVNRELWRAERIGGFLGCEEYETHDRTFAHIGLCTIKLGSLADELRPVVENHRAKGGNTAKPATSESSGIQRVNDLLQAIERHRLMFLYWATARRQNPLAVTSRTGIDERVDREEVAGWAEMRQAIDADGAFLWIHRNVLDRYAQSAVAAFGPGDGTRPHERDASGRGVPVEGGSFPYWSLDEDCFKYLEGSSDTILEAARLLAEADQSEVVLELVRLAMSLARPAGHDRWREAVIVHWAYLGDLDSLIARAKTARVELAMPPSANPARGSSKSEVVDPQGVADLVVLFMVLRDVHRIGREYPDALSQVEREDWIRELTASVQRGIRQSGLQFVAGILESPEVSELNDADRFGVLMASVLTWHPAASEHDGTQGKIEVAIKAAMKSCQASASEAVRVHMRRLADVMVIACRCPNGKSVKDFAEPSRALQVLHRYWALAATLILTQANTKVGITPHPLLHLIENLRDRIRACFDQLQSLEGAGEVRAACDAIIGCLTEGEANALSVVPEWADGQVQLVERFIARSRLSFGPRSYPLTSSEEFFIGMLEPMIAEHAKRLKKAWEDMLARATASAKAGADTPSKSPAAGVPKDEKNTPKPAVVLGAPGSPVTVRGKQKKPLTDGKYAVVAALIEAGNDGLTKDGIEAVRASARRMLEELREDSDWATVIVMPGQTNGRYRIRL